MMCDRLFSVNIKYEKKTLLFEKRPKSEEIVIYKDLLSYTEIYRRIYFLVLSYFESRYMKDNSISMQYTDLLFEETGII